MWHIGSAALVRVTKMSSGHSSDPASLQATVTIAKIRIKVPAGNASQLGNG